MTECHAQTLVSFTGALFALRHHLRGKVHEWFGQREGTQQFWVYATRRPGQLLYTSDEPIPPDVRETLNVEFFGSFMFSRRTRGCLGDVKEECMGGRNWHDTLPVVAENNLYRSLQIVHWQGTPFDLAEQIEPHVPNGWRVAGFTHREISSYAGPPPFPDDIKYGRCYDILLERVE